MGQLTELQERRAFQCHLTPDRALGSVEEAGAFLRDRGLLTRTADCTLPSLYEACHEDPYKPGSSGFATWPATKWPWFGELAGRGYLVPAIHCGKNLLVTSEVAALADPICRAEIERMRAADRGWGRLLDHLAAAGPSSIDDLRTELRLKRPELKSLRARRWNGAGRSSRARCTSPPAKGTGIRASWRAGTRPIRVLAEQSQTPAARSGPWSPLACARRSSRRKPSCGAGSPGSGTGPIRSSTTSSARGSSAEWTVTSWRQARTDPAEGRKRSAISENSE
jgi:hypothetical protein